MLDNLQILSNEQHNKKHCIPRQNVFQLPSRTKPEVNLILSLPRILPAKGLQRGPYFIQLLYGIAMRLCRSLMHTNLNGRFQTGYCLVYVLCQCAEHNGELYSANKEGHDVTLTAILPTGTVYKYLQTSLHYLRSFPPSPLALLIKQICISQEKKQKRKQMYIYISQNNQVI